MRGSKLKTFIFIFFIIMIFACIGLTNGSSRKSSVIEQVASKMITFPQEIFMYTKSWIMKDEGFFANIDELKAENEKIKEENNELKTRLMNYEVILSENLTLKEHVNLTNSYPDYDVIVADIIGESASNWEDVYTINRGERDGVKPNMVVVAEEGLVGYIKETTETTSKIITILDPGNSISSRTTRTRDSVVSKGSAAINGDNRLKVEKIPTDLTLVEGDRIETSGLGGRYPKGIPLGEVEKFIVKKNPIENTAILKTYVDFNKLETVAIITEKTK